MMTPCYADWPEESVNIIIALVRNVVMSGYRGTFFYSCVVISIRHETRGRYYLITKV